MLCNSDEDNDGDDDQSGYFEESELEEEFGSINDEDHEKWEKYDAAPVGHELEPQLFELSQFELIIKDAILDIFKEFFFWEKHQEETLKMLTNNLELYSCKFFLCKGCFF